MFKKIIILFLFSLPAYSQSYSQTVTFYCPSVESIQIEPNTQNPWGNFQYTSQVAILISKNKVTFRLQGWGEGQKIDSFQSAGWVDETFVCNYKSEGNNVIVIADNEPCFTLNRMVKNCYFGSLPANECQADNPQDCPMSCVLKKV